jgi:hypothetical protein
MKKLISLVMVAFLLVGCAHGPQKVDVTPVYDYDSPIPDEVEQVEEQEKTIHPLKKVGIFIVWTLLQPEFWGIILLLVLGTA